MQTNILIFDIAGTGLAPSEFSARLKSRGVLMNSVGPRHMRAVTHYDVTREGCATAVGAAAEVISEALAAHG